MGYHIRESQLDTLLETWREDRFRRALGLFFQGSLDANLANAFLFHRIADA